MCTVRLMDGDPRRIVVNVRDTGIGIAPDVLPRIFTAFEQGGMANDAPLLGDWGWAWPFPRRLVELAGRDHPGRRVPVRDRELYLRWSFPWLGVSP